VMLAIALISLIKTVTFRFEDQEVLASRSLSGKGEPLQPQAVGLEQSGLPRTFPESWTSPLPTTVNCTTWQSSTSVISDSILSIDILPVTESGSQRCVRSLPSFNVSPSGDRRRLANSWRNWKILHER
jgi:hypothetical protein